MIIVTFSQLMERSKHQEHQQQPQNQVSKNEYRMTELGPGAKREKSKIQRQTLKPILQVLSDYLLLFLFLYEGLKQLIQYSYVNK